ncbi:hypothetical protein ACFVHQ_15515 [Actinomycetes bacterium NPDC127524]
MEREHPGAEINHLKSSIVYETAQFERWLEPDKETRMSAGMNPAGFF